MDGVTNSSGKPASPGQQQQFDMLLGRARQMMGASAEEWLSALKADPVQAAVTMGTSTVRELATMSEKAGQKVDPAVLLNVGVQFVKDVAGIANEASLVPDEQLEQYLHDVMSQSIMEYLRMDAKDGILSPQDKDRAQGMLSQMQEPGDPASPDNTPAHENAEAPAMEQQEGSEEDQMGAELAAIRQRKGGQP